MPSIKDNDSYVTQGDLEVQEYLVLRVETVKLLSAAVDCSRTEWQYLTACNHGNEIIGCMYPCGDKVSS